MKLEVKFSESLKTDMVVVFSESDQNIDAAFGSYLTLKGEPGYTPVKGVDYFDGQPGKDGKDGYTPVKGTDYFTEADKAEMVADVIAALPVYDGSVTSA